MQFSKPYYILAYQTDDQDYTVVQLANTRPESGLHMRYSFLKCTFISFAAVSDYKTLEAYFTTGIMLTQAANGVLVLSYGPIAIYDIH